jgi:hypothetical protein
LKAILVLAKASAVLYARVSLTCIEVWAKEQKTVAKSSDRMSDSFFIVWKD